MATIYTKFRVSWKGGMGSWKNTKTASQLSGKFTDVHVILDFITFVCVCGWVSGGVYVANSM